jgi:hypothetical protein
MSESKKIVFSYIEVILILFIHEFPNPIWTKSVVFEGQHPRFHGTKSSQFK